MRALASVQVISDLSPIPDADSIERATILGWHTVVRKGAYQVGDLCVFCEIDSFIPTSVDSTLTRPGHEPKEYLGIQGERLKTVRLRGQISQGLVLPMSVLPQEYPVNTDVSEILGIVKYEPPLTGGLAGTARGNFPSFIPKTDETRVQVLQRVLTENVGLPCYITEKLDGSSMTVFRHEGELHVCSRNTDLKDDSGNSFWQMAHSLNLDSLQEGFAIQGELIGGKIQGNPLKRPAMEFYAFNVFFIPTGEYLNYHSFVAVCKAHNIPMVPIFNDNFNLIDNIDELVELATGNSILNESKLREGIVIRPLIEQRDARLGRLSFKVINPEYLLKHGG